VSNEEEQEKSVKALMVLRDTFLPIANREAGYERGEFLTNFAKAVAHADPANLVLLSPVCVLLIIKYGITSRTFESSQPHDASKPETSH
jgi:hypothetical protein